MLLLGHRGASADAPENTLAAFREAAGQQADGVELDAMVCGSGEVVVCHDERLGRLAGLDWEVARTPWSRLSRVDVGTALGFGPAQVPLLSAVLDALPPHFLVNVELKCDTLRDGGLAHKVGQLLTQKGWTDRAVVSSFNAGCLLRFALAFPHLRRGYLIDPDKAYALHGHLLAPLLSAYSIHPHESQCTEERVAHWHRMGLKVAAWTVDDPERARGLEGWGVDLLITNRPGGLRAALR